MTFADDTQSRKQPRSNKLFKYKFLVSDTD